MRVELSFDDGCVLDLKLVELLAKYNLRATFYVPVMWESVATLKGWQPLTKNDLLQISNHHEIGSHSITHPLLTQIPYAVAHYEIVESRGMLEGLIKKPVTKFAYPRGYATDQIRGVARKIYSSARSTLVGNTDPPEDPIWENTSVHIGCPRTEYDRQHWFDYAMKHLDYAKRKKNGYFHAFGHSHEINKYNAWDATERLFQALQGLQ